MEGGGGVVKSGSWEGRGGEVGVMITSIVIKVNTDSA